MNSGVIGGFPTGLLGGFVAAVLVWIAVKRLRRARLEADGWRTLRPSWLIHATFAGCVLFLAVVTVALFTFDDTRADAQSERLWLLVLILAFAGGSIYLVRTTYARTISWSRDSLRVRRWFQMDEIRALSEVASLTRNDFTGAYTLQFAEGSQTQFPVASHGATELAAKLNASKGDDLPDV